MLRRSSDLDGFFGISKQRERDMRFGTWNGRSYYTASSLKAVGSELAKYNLGVVAVQEVRGG
jgi:hypothetical protein